MRPRLPGAPRPSPQQVQLLDEAIQLLESVDFKTSFVPDLKEVITRLDALDDSIAHFDHNAFPDGFRPLVTEGRWLVATREPESALGQLRQARWDLDLYWTDDEELEA